MIEALRETQLWCWSRVDPTAPAQCLRSAKLRPPAYPEQWYCTHLHPEWIDGLISRRRELLEAAFQPPEQLEGRVLCLLHEGDTAMGEGEPASKGFIDDAYFPPWDTWFAHVANGSEAGVLFAWIPREFEELVDDAIAVAATEPIVWLDVVIRETPGWWFPSLPLLREAARVLLSNGDAT